MKMTAYMFGFAAILVASGGVAAFDTQGTHGLKHQDVVYDDWLQTS